MRRSVGNPQDIERVVRLEPQGRGHYVRVVAVAVAHNDQCRSPNIRKYLTPSMEFFLRGGKKNSV